MAEFDPGRRTFLKNLGAAALVGVAGVTVIEKISKDSGDPAPDPKIPTTPDGEGMAPAEKEQGVLDDTESKEDYPIRIENITEEDFEALVDYIEREGFTVTERGISSDRQYTFLDSKGNRHALITIKRDEMDEPSMQGKVKQVSVWAYREGIRDQDHFFGYIITGTEVVTHLPSTEEEIQDIKLGFGEFLAKVKK